MIFIINLSHVKFVMHVKNTLFVSMQMLRSIKPIIGDVLSDT